MRDGGAPISAPEEPLNFRPRPIFASNAALVLQEVFECIKKTKKEKKKKNRKKNTKKKTPPTNPVTKKNKNKNN